MKELTIEQKAEAYDKALDRAKKWYNAPNIDKMPTYGNRIVEEIFPELIESEDERIRKALINVFATHKYYEVFFGVFVKDILAWLEKQGKNLIMAKSPQLGKQKPAWSEEDEEMLDGIILRCEKYGHQEQIDWLKSLKERIKL